MRPIKLTMQAFGSYGKKTEIDFTKPTQNLFLISGDTGSGKTTIFDAMVFALYGEASSESNKKDGMELQSHFVDTFTEPYVELEFTENEGGEEVTYVVKRMPRHKKGNNKTPASTSVELTMPDRSVYPCKETNKKLEEIVGLSKTQFMQVGMIAQGEFMQMLRAKTSEKKEIFQKLFHTEVYDKTVKELEKRSKEKEKDFGRIRTVCQTEADHIRIPSEYERAEVMNTLISNIRNSEKYNTVDVENLISELALLCQKLEEEKHALKKEEETAAEAYEEAVRATTAANELTGRFSDLDHALRILDECEAEKEAVKEKEILAELLTAAYDINPVYVRAQDAEKLLKATIRDLEEQERKLPELEKLAKEANTEYEQKREIANRKRADYGKTEERVTAAREVFAELEKETKNKNKYKKAVDVAEANKEKAEKQQLQLEETEKLLKIRIGELEGVAARLVVWTNRQEKIEAYKLSISALHKQEEAISAQKNVVKEARQTYVEAREAYEQQYDEYKNKKRMYLDAQAGYIAEEYLKPDQPCPVCGSIHHPSPCELSDAHKEITRDVLDKLEKKVESANKKVEKASKASGNAGTRLEAMEGTFSRDLSSLRLQMKEEIASVTESVELSLLEQENLSWSREVDGKVHELEAANQEYQRIQEKLGTLDGQKAQAKENIKKATEAYQDANERLTSTLAVLEKLLKEKTYESLKAAEDMLKKAGTAKGQAEAEEQTAENNLTQAKKNLNNTKTLIRKHEEDLPKLKEDYQTKKKDYFSIMEEKDLSDFEWKGFVQKHKKPEIKALQKAVADYDKKKASAMRVQETAMKAIAGKERPDMMLFREMEKNAEVLAKNARNLCAKNQEYLTADTEAYKKLESKRDERTQISKEYATISHLYKTFGGKYKNARMDLETFALRYYLKRILDYANSRFLQMSGGQYLLKMMDLEDANEGGNKGLDLMIYSLVTNQERSIKTLSGGESFMAALALALGMADEIQASTSAVNLDVMFIDEGFGSLDEHSRNQAVRVLKNMAGGSKLIGIISHVTELKQEIDDQLLVEKTEKGSQIRWS